MEFSLVENNNETYADGNFCFCFSSPHNRDYDRNLAVVHLEVVHLGDDSRKQGREQGD